MSATVKVRRVGGAIGITLPTEIRERYKIVDGDDLTLVETDRGILLSPYDPNYDKIMAAAKRGAKKFRNALRALAQK